MLNMLTYKQNIFDVLVKYENGISEYSIKSESGVRIEHSNNMTEVYTCEDTMAIDDVKLSISNEYLCKLNNLVSKFYKYLEANKIKLSSYLYLHNEKVLINDIKDLRNYGFLKIVFEKNDYFTIEEIPITTTNFDVLENEVQKVMDKNSPFLKFSIVNKYHKKFNDIPIVFSPHAAGFLIHEILGHTLEYDIYKYYADKYKYLKFNHKLNVKDDPRKFSELTGIGRYDDMGIPTDSISLVKNGVISNVFSLNADNSRDGFAYGVGRRENYKYNVLPRARCTYLEPVDNMDQSAIVSKYRRCILVNKIHSGGVNPKSGDFELSGIGFLVNNNNIQNLIGNLKISGNLLRNFDTIEYIGNDLEFLGGYCFKLGQNVRIAVGAPATSMYDLTVEGDFCD